MVMRKVCADFAGPNLTVGAVAGWDGTAAGLPAGARTARGAGWLP
jgi:hypothetical protein